VEFVSNVYGLSAETRVIQCNIRDITKRKQMEGGAAAKRGTLPRPALKNSRIAVFSQGRDLRYIWSV